MMRADLMNGRSRKVLRGCVIEYAAGHGENGIPDLDRLRFGILFVFFYNFRPKADAVAELFSYGDIAVQN